MVLILAPNAKRRLLQHRAGLLDALQLVSAMRGMEILSEGISVKLKPCSYVVLMVLASTGCSMRFADISANAASGTSLCEESRAWESVSATQALQMTPQIVEDENGRSYHFDLGGRGGLRYLDASCGFGTYAECRFDVTRSQGGIFRFSEMSTFGLWETRRGFYLVYRVVAPKEEYEKDLRRIVKVGNPPSEICNQIGDYSNLM